MVEAVFVVRALCYELSGKRMFERRCVCKYVCMYVC